MFQLYVSSQKLKPKSETSKMASIGVSQPVFFHTMEDQHRPIVRHLPAQLFAEWLIETSICSTQTISIHHHSSPFHSSHIFHGPNGGPRQPWGSKRTASTPPRAAEDECHDLSKNIEQTWDRDGIGISHHHGVNWDLLFIYIYNLYVF